MLRPCLWSEGAFRAFRIALPYAKDVIYSTIRYQ